MIIILGISYKVSIMSMHKCKITVLQRTYDQELANEYLADPNFGPCEILKEGQEFILDRDGFWRMPEGFCAEAWDAISRYIYVQISGGTVLENWFNSDKIAVACCSDPVRKVVFKLERLDD